MNPGVLYFLFIILATLLVAAETWWHDNRNQ